MVDRRRRPYPFLRERLRRLRLGGCRRRTHPITPKTLPELEKAYADLSHEAAYAIAHRNDRQKTSSTLRLASLQTCSTCGAAYKVGEKCSTCLFQIRMDTETCTHDADRHGPESGCIECRCTSTTGHPAKETNS